jgi:lipoprotein
MKKIWLLTFLGVLLTGCQQKVNPEALQIYNDRLMSIQEQSVNSLEQYYRSLET